MKGLRAVSDFEYEMEMAQMNYRLAEVETLFIAANPVYSFLRSSLVKEICRYGGDVTSLVPELVFERLQERLGSGLTTGPDRRGRPGPVRPRAWIGPATGLDRSGHRAGPAARRLKLGIGWYPGRLINPTSPDTVLAMPHSRKNPSARLDPRKPLVFSTLDLGRSPGSEYSQQRTVPAPAYAHAGLAGVPEGSDVELDVRMEAVSEGVLVTATARAQITGECARCLEPISQPVEVQGQELFAYSADDGPDDAEGYSLQGDLLDFEPVLHDALVLAVPLAPLCREDCPGLCVECGVPLAQAGPDHGHGPAIDPRWASLQQAASQFGGPGAGEPELGETEVNGNGRRATSAGEPDD